MTQSLALTNEHKMPALQSLTQAQEPAKKDDATSQIELQKKYKWILDKYEELIPGDLLVTKEGEVTRFHKRTLLNLLAEVDDYWNEKLIREGGLCFEVDKMEFIMKIDIESKHGGEQLRLLHYMSPEIIVGKGKSGLIHRVFLVCQAVYAVVKEVDHRSSNSVLQEQYILNHLHANRKLRQIQHNPISIIHVIRSKFGLIFPVQYKGDFWNVVDISKNLTTYSDRLQKSKELVSAAVEVWLLGCAHRDIKPNNFFVDKSGNVLLADFEQAMLKDDVGNLRFREHEGTPGFFSKGDRNELEKAVVEKDVKKHFLAAQASDVFALGTTIYMFLNDNDKHMYPYYNPTNRYLVGTFPEGKFIANFKGAFHYPAQVIKMLEKMVELDPKKRATTEEVAAFWKDLDCTPANNGLMHSVCCKVMNAARGSLGYLAKCWQSMPRCNLDFKRLLCCRKVKTINS